MVVTAAAARNRTADASITPQQPATTTPAYTAVPLTG
jgi:hypothetical protein